MSRELAPLTRTLQRLAVRLDELAAYRDRAAAPLGPARFTLPEDGAAADDAAGGATAEEPRIGPGGDAGARGPWSLAPGDAWPAVGPSPVRLEFEAVVPEAWRGERVAIRLDVGGEGLLLVDDVALGGLNEHHREHPLLDRARGGEVVRIAVEAVAHGLFGHPVERPRLREAALVVPDDELRALHRDLAASLDAASYLEAHGRAVVAQPLADAIDDVLRDVALDREGGDAYLARLAMAPGGSRVLASIWERWRFDVEPAPLPDGLRERLPELRARFAASLESIRGRYPAEGALWLTGHAHIDLAWLWPLEETRRKARRTFATVVGLLDRSEAFHFNQSSAQLYAFVEEDDPVLFERVREHVRRGRWDVVGGMWVEPDGNLLAGESWVRQLLHGQRYLEARLGRRARVGWLPDTFGYAANLPQLLRGAGIDAFVTTKLTWNEREAFPHDLYLWEGLDGSRVLAHSFDNPHAGYNGHVEARDLVDTWRAFRGTRHHHTSLLAIGHGDGGGGPTDEMLEAFERLRDHPGMPRLRMGRVEDFFAEVEREHLPVWVGEKYLQFHRGTYTTQARTKALHRRLEGSLPAAEVACSLALAALGRAYPARELADAWTVLLRNQFHDILPGSSIHSVYETAERELGAAAGATLAVRDAALVDLGAEVAADPAGSTLVVWNLTLDERPLRLEAPAPADGATRLVAPDGREVASAVVGDRMIAADPVLRVPPLGYLALTLAGPRAGSDAATVRGTDGLLENEHLMVGFDPDGTIASLVAKATGREALAGPGNALWAYDDVPRAFEAWEIDEAYEREGSPLGLVDGPRLVEANAARAAVRVVRSVGAAVVEQDYRLWRGGRRLEIVTRVRWRGRRRMLRALVPLAIRSQVATFETAFGAVARPTHANTGWDAAMFEVPGLRWADLSEPGFGVSLLTDAKYGYSARGGTLGLTLLRSPVYPDPHADAGEHAFTYALYPHDGDWRAGTVAEAHDLNEPLVALPGGGGSWPRTRAFASGDAGSLRLSALKQAEDGAGLILRLYEAHGARGRGQLALDLGIDDATCVDTLEEARGPAGERLRLVSGGLQADFGPFEVVAARLRLG